MEDQALEKTNRVNLLLDFYEHLLTDKQQTILKHYFHDDFSLGEISEIFHISRQAVYEHIKRAELLLREYEQKLQLLAKHEQRTKYIQEINALLGLLESGQKHQLQDLVQKLYDLD